MPEGAFPDAAAPLVWVRAQKGPPAYVNVGDALSPYLVTMVSGRPTTPASFASKRTRMAAIGTIAQNLQGGVAHVWGSGCSPWSNPLSPARAPYAPPPDTRLVVHAARGPRSAALLGAGGVPDMPFGDPAMLLPRFYAPTIPARWELGVVLHLAELADRAVVARPKPERARYAATPSDGSVRLITMVAPDSLDGVRGKLDELLACRRIVSTSLHGYALAAAYGIPCLYIGADRGADGLARAVLGVEAEQRVNARFVDLLMGLGEREIVYWRQHRGRSFDWDALIAALDAGTAPLSLTDPEALMAACPAGCAPLAARPRKTIWEHPMIAAVPVAAAGRTAWLGRALAGRFGRAVASRFGRAP